MLRMSSAGLLAVLSLFALTTVAQADGFDAYVAGLKPEATARGISDATFQSAIRGLTADPSMERLTRRQPELVKPIGGYIERRTSGALLSSGRVKAKANARLLRDLGRRTGVDPYVVAAIWGMETGYGGNIGNSDVFRSLATLGWMQYRGDFFRKEFLHALTILQNENISRARMIGSWAGAMGQTQFIPSSFLQYAVDFDGDGTRDLWRSIGDALASTANYLKSKGWVAGQPWGVPVVLPESVVRSAATQGWSAWARLGVKAHDGIDFPTTGEATLFFPAGHEGPAFLITDNYDVIRDYNSSDAYSLSAALLADRLRGGAALNAAWPTGDTLNKTQRLAVQAALRKRGHVLSNDTGRITKDVRLAVAVEQRRLGVTPDGYPDQQFLARISR